MSIWNNRIPPHDLEPYEWPDDEDDDMEQSDRVQMKAKLKDAITQHDKSDYETLRNLLIAELGYDAFRDLQREVFTELYGYNVEKTFETGEFET